MLASHGACKIGKTYIGELTDNLIENVEGLEADGIDGVELGRGGIREVDRGKSSLCTTRNTSYDGKSLFSTVNGIDANIWDRRRDIACFLVGYTSTS